MSRGSKPCSVLKVLEDWLRWQAAQGSMLRCRLPALRSLQQAGTSGAGVVRGLSGGVGLGLEGWPRLGQVDRKGRLVISLGVMENHVPSVSLTDFFWP